MNRLEANSVSKGFSETLNRVALEGERIILQRRGKDMAVLIPLEDLALLEQIEDTLDAADRLSDPNETPVAYESVRGDLGLD
jgi:PHD/YefM family antitoxin component YafN of YafNO toxin-antitoxin module